MIWLLICLVCVRLGWLIGGIVGERYWLDDVKLAPGTMPGGR